MFFFWGGGGEYFSGLKSCFFCLDIKRDMAFLRSVLSYAIFDERQDPA